MQGFEREHPMPPDLRPHADRPDPLVGSGWRDLRRTAEAELDRIAARRRETTWRTDDALPRPELR